MEEGGSRVRVDRHHSCTAWHFLGVPESHHHLRGRREKLRLREAQ